MTYKLLSIVILFLVSLLMWLGVVTLALAVLP